jgi:hypothetical protein
VSAPLTRFFNASAVVCDAEPQAQGQVAVHVANDGIDFSENGPKLVFKSADIVDTVYPRLARHETERLVLIDPNLNSTNVSSQLRPLRIDQVSVETQRGRNGSWRGLVRLSGRGFVNTTDMLCHIGEIASVRAVVVNSSSAECSFSVRRSIARCERLDVSIAGQSLRNQDKMMKTICFFSDVIIAAISPQCGPATGRTRIVVTGGPFTVLDPAQYYRCVFGSLSSEASILSVSQLTCSVPSIAAQSLLMGELSVSFSVEVGGVPVVSTVTYTYAPLPRVLQIVPDTTWAGSSTDVEVHGRGFRATTLLRCRFGQTAIVPARFISESLIRCSLPTMARAEPMALHVSNNLQDFSLQDVSLGVRRRPQVLAFSPRYLIPTGNPASLSIIGRDLWDLPSIRCLIGEDVTKFTFYSSTVGACAVPVSRSAISVQVALVDTYSSHVQTVLSTAPDQLAFVTTAAWQMFPTSAVAGSTTSPSFTTKGVPKDSSWFPEMRLACRLCVPAGNCSISTRAREVQNGDEGSVIKCGEMVVGSAGRGVVSVLAVNAFGEEEVLSSPVMVREGFHITRISPPFGTTTTRTTVTLEGRNFPMGHKGVCVLDGTIQQPASLISSGVVQCQMPKYSIGSKRIVVVSLSFLGLDYESPTSSAFRYVDPPILLQVSPPVIPSNARSSVHIRGYNLMSSDAASCLFGDYHVAAVVLNDQEAVCFVDPTGWPQPSKTNSTVVRFSMNGHNDTGAGVSIRIYPPISVMDAQPRLILTRGNAIEFTLDSPVVDAHSGARIKSASCRVGGKRVKAMVASERLLRCSCPTNLRPGLVATGISLNGQHFVPGPSLLVIDEPMIMDVSPRSVPADTYQVIELHGSAFPRVPTLLCRFGDDFPASTALWISESLVICRLQLSQPGQVIVYFSVNGADFYDSSFSIKIETHPQGGVALQTSTPTQGKIAVSLTGTIDECSRLECLFATASSPRRREPT